MKKIITLIGCMVIALIVSQRASSQVKDIDGNVYKTVKIGTQIWMAENLKTTKLNDGVKIQLVEEDDKYIAMNTAAYCWYKNDTAFRRQYGALYNLPSVKTGKLCPVGWHVPSDVEWLKMEMVVGLTEDDAMNGVWDRGKDHGAKLKDQSSWGFADNTVKSAGFAARPGGLRADDGTFMNAAEKTGMNFSIGAFFWTSTPREGSDLRNAKDAYFRSLNKDNSIERNISSGFRGHSVRCVKD